MTTITTFTFNPFQENTYIIQEPDKTCWIIDPGCYSPDETERLKGFIRENGLTPVKLLNTHCHIDHVFGNKTVSEAYGLKPVMTRIEQEVLEACKVVSRMYGLKYDPSPEPLEFLEGGDELALGSARFKVLFTPGHSPGSICFYNQEEGYVISGDVLFEGSIGRTDLPGGDYDTLIESIRQNLMILPDDTKVYSGHGPTTTVGNERKYNPFLR